MIKIENVYVHGWEAAVRGARNPMNSWDKSDSHLWESSGIFEVGPDDCKLLSSLSKAGDDHGKWERFITVTCDITAPLYWWKEFDTYKVGTVANSCSTMHKIHEKEFTLDDFSGERLIIDEPIPGRIYSPEGMLIATIQNLNKIRLLYNETKDKRYWDCLIQLLPTSYNQRRTVQLNYQVLKHMYHARKNHKLDEWRDFCKWVETLPYIDLVIGKG